MMMNVEQLDGTWVDTMPAKMRSRIGNGEEVKIMGNNT